MPAWTVTCPCGVSFTYMEVGEEVRYRPPPLAALGRCEEQTRRAFRGEELFVDPLEHCGKMRVAFEVHTGKPPPG
ncbi:MAG: hypothetical protein ACLFWG_09520 [Longimicrobiales bacterium]